MHFYPHKFFCIFQTKSSHNANDDHYTTRNTFRPIKNLKYTTNLGVSAASRNILRILGISYVRAETTAKFCTVVKTGCEESSPQMLTRDQFAVANLLVVHSCNLHILVKWQGHRRRYRGEGGLGPLTFFV